jgi:hypothetical protein
MECPNCGLAKYEVFRKDWVKKFRCRGCETLDTTQTLWLSDKESIPLSKFYYEVILVRAREKRSQGNPKNKLKGKKDPKTLVYT